MEVFKETRFDFLGRKWWFILPSLILTLAGLASLFLKGGPRYGIDFWGGAVMEVRWEGAPPIERIRAAVLRRRPVGHDECQRPSIASTHSLPHAVLEPPHT
jgi:preprotein translocase subunit SecF